MADGTTDAELNRTFTTVKLKALILDDSNFDRKRLRRLARHTRVPIEVKDCASLIAFQKYLDSDVYDVVFIDYLLPEGDGLEALRILKDHPKNAKAAPILIAGDLDADVVASAFKQGCADYLAKRNVDSRSLRHSILSSVQP